MIPKNLFWTLRKLGKEDSYNQRMDEQRVRGEGSRTEYEKVGESVRQLYLTGREKGNQGC